MSDYDSIRSGLEALGTEARGVIARANQEIAQSDRLLSLASAVRWLATHNIHVHKNTIRHWCLSGRIQAVRRAPGPRFGGGKRAEILIPLETLVKIAACPVCGSR